MSERRTRVCCLWTLVSACAVMVATGCSPSEVQPAAQAAAPAAAGQPTQRTVASNGINLRITEMGKGPLVILLHGFPESGYSWRHQLPALAEAGYHAVAPDMRGYGKSDKPAAVEDYDIQHLTGDVVGLIDALGEKTAVVVGHDWGSIIAWNCLLLHPDRFTALVPLSVPYGGRAAVSPLETMKKNFGENFYYVLYFQEPGVAEAEFDADPRGLLSRLYLSPDSPRDHPTVTDPKRVAGGWIPRLGPAKGLPPWLTQADLDHYVNEFKESGFRGGVNYYRNFHRNWETTPQLAGATIAQPVLFIAGAQDGVIRGASAEQLTKSMSAVAKDLRGVKLFPGAGHWVQQERPRETNEAIIEFLKDVAKPAKATN
jgi:pimeloyl-ACP methyl ester carboxylesterase